MSGHWWLIHQSRHDQSFLPIGVKNRCCVRYEWALMAYPSKPSWSIISTYRGVKVFTNLHWLPTCFLGDYQTETEGVYIYIYVCVCVKVLPIHTILSRWLRFYKCMQFSFFRNTIKLKIHAYTLMQTYSCPTLIMHIYNSISKSKRYLKCCLLKLFSHIF
jgi:hypothetical protein